MKNKIIDYETSSTRINYFYSSMKPITMKIQGKIYRKFCMISTKKLTKFSLMKYRLIGRIHLQSMKKLMILMNFIRKIWMRLFMSCRARLSIWRLKLPCWKSINLTMSEWKSSGWLPITSWKASRRNWFYLPIKLKSRTIAMA